MWLKKKTEIEMLNDEIIKLTEIYNELASSWENLTEKARQTEGGKIVFNLLAEHKKKLKETYDKIIKLTKAEEERYSDEKAKRELDYALKLCKTERTKSPFESLKEFFKKWW